MNLSTKKELATKTFKVGKKRITFVKSRLEEIKEAITKQDIRDLKNSGAILINEIKGKKTVVRKKKRSPGNVRKKINVKKQDYVKLTRRLRTNVRTAKIQGKISLEEYKDIRKKIRNKIFKSKAHLKEFIGGLKK